MKHRHTDEHESEATCLVLDIIGSIPEASVFRLLPTGALHFGVERLFWRARLAPQRAHLQEQGLVAELLITEGQTGARI